MRNRAAKAKPMKSDVYRTITDRIVRDLERGVRPWLKPWSADNTEGKIVRPLRANATPYRGTNVLMLWSMAVEDGSSSPFWMTYRQAIELNAHVRKGACGTPVVYADRIVRTETDSKTGEEAEREIPLMKGYIVFNCDQIEGLPVSVAVNNESIGLRQAAPHTGAVSARGFCRSCRKSVARNIGKTNGTPVRIIESNIAGQITIIA